VSTHSSACNLRLVNGLKLTGCTVKTAGRFHSCFGVERDHGGDALRNGVGCSAVATSREIVSGLTL
jgi:hypothetical protein